MPSQVRGKREKLRCCHLQVHLGGNPDARHLGDVDVRILLAMALGQAVVLLGVVLEDADLFPFGVAQHFGSDLHIRQVGVARARDWPGCTNAGHFGAGH